MNDGHRAAGVARVPRRCRAAAGRSRRRAGSRASRRSRARRRARARRRCPTARPGRRRAARPSCGWRRGRRRPRAATAGTALMASSATEAIVGSTRMPTMMPAASWLNCSTSSPKTPRRISGVTKVSAKKPKTMVGTPASTSSTGLTIRRTRGVAYSREVDRAQQAERDRDEQADDVRYSVPTSSGTTPKDCWSPASCGVHLRAEEEVRRSPTSPRKPTVSRTSERTISTSWSGPTARRRQEERDLDRALPGGTRPAGAGQGRPRRPCRLRALRRRRGPPWPSSACSSVIGTILAASAIVGLVGQDEVHEGLHLGPLDAPSPLGYMNSGRDERLVGAVLDRLRCSA